MQYAFIIGIARSGTSILGELLCAHPQVTYLYEAYKLWEFGGAGPNGSHRLTAEHATPKVTATIRGEIQEWFRLNGTPGNVLVEKCPRNVLRVPYLHAIFPEGGIIHIVRDGRDVACSMVPGCGGDSWNHLKPPSWTKLYSKYSGAVRCALAWDESIRIAWQDLATIPHLQIRYEDLLSTPEEVVETLFAYLELDVDPAVTGFLNKIQDTTRGSYHAQHQGVWFRDNHRVRVGRYQENLTPDELHTINQLIGPTLTQLGYQV
ncbi:MAG: sulfotransferase [Candidatus Neomarinimicrobiota bacterium]